MLRFLLASAASVAALPALAATIEVSPVVVTEWKPIFGQVETRNRVPARSRIGGTIISLEVSEGDRVEAGQRIALIEDPKLNFQVDALDARLEALGSQRETAVSELARGEQLMERGVFTSQRLEELRTAVNVIEGEISSLEAERLVVRRQIEEGAVLAPDAGIALVVPLSLGSVVVPGEAIAVVGGGGFYLRLSVPERHAAELSEGDMIQIGGEVDMRRGILAKLYPQIEGGRVQADVEIEGLDHAFVGRRVPVRLPVGERTTILLPDEALSHRGGLDFVTVETEHGLAERVVVPGEAVALEGMTWREILTGLRAGEMVLIPDE